MVRVVKCRFCSRNIKIYRDSQVYFRCCGIQQEIAKNLVTVIFSSDKSRKSKQRVGKPIPDDVILVSEYGENDKQSGI